jgi:hypothetical protein
MNHRAVRPLAGLGTVLAIVAIVAIAISLFQGGYAAPVPITVVSPARGLGDEP